MKSIEPRFEQFVYIYAWSSRHPTRELYTKDGWSMRDCWSNHKSYGFRNPKNHLEKEVFIDGGTLLQRCEYSPNRLGKILLGGIIWWVQDRRGFIFGEGIYLLNPTDRKLSLDKNIYNSAAGRRDGDFKPTANSFSTVMWNIYPLKPPPSPLFKSQGSHYEFTLQEGINKAFLRNFKTSLFSGLFNLCAALQLKS